MSCYSYSSFPASQDRIKGASKFVQLYHPLKALSRVLAQAAFLGYTLFIDNKIMNKRGQSIIEYALIAVLVILGIYFMGPYVLRSVGAHFK
jgi:hypothetical protein